MSKTHCIKLEAVKEFPLPVDKVWGLLSHTNRLHEMVGMSSVSFEPYAGGTHLLYQKASLQGWPGKFFSWKEYPYEWVYQRNFSVLREFDKGFLQRYKRGVELEPTEKGTKVRAFVELTPRWKIFKPLAVIRGKKWIRGIHHYCAQFLALWIQRKQYVYPHKILHGIRSRGWTRQLAQFTSSTPKMEKLLERLKQYVMESYDDEVTEIRPKDLAAHWEQDPFEVVRLFLFATKEQLLTLKWVVLCPLCRTPKLRLSSLSGIPSNCFCDFCQKPFQVDLDRTTELRFSVHPSVRVSKFNVHSQNGPNLTPHTFIQKYLPPGAIWKVDAEMGEERFSCRTLRNNISCHLIPTVKHSSKPTRVRLIFTREGWLAQTLIFRPGRQEIEFRNESHTPLVVTLEKAGGDKQALSAAEATSLQEFLFLFPKEVPSPGRKLPLNQTSFLLVDIKGATEHYMKVGDGLALNQVQHLLAFLVKLVQENKGGIVKINGDTLLAVFSHSGKALEAAFKIQKQIRSFNKMRDIKPPFILRTAVHKGQVIAFFRSGKLDYFGEAINHLFQIQKRGVGGDIVLSKEYFQDESVQQVLKDYLFDHEIKEIRKDQTTYAICYITPVFDEDQELPTQSVG